MKIFCCQCEKEVEARPTTGAEIYPNYPKLASKNFYRCDGCRGYVGCHPGTITPLGNIPTPELRAMRVKIHGHLDRLWKSGRMRRGAVYAKLSAGLGYRYHTGEVKSVAEAAKVLNLLVAINGESTRQRREAD